MTSAGISTLPTGQLTICRPIIPPTASTNTPPVPVSTKSNYRYLLPNLDLSLAVTDTVKVRFDASRTLTRRR